MTARRRGFNPRSPRGGATCITATPPPWGLVSIHAPREGERRKGYHALWILVCFNPRSPRGGATTGCRSGRGWSTFQSTLPARGSDPPRGTRQQQMRVSIHAPREGERRSATSSVSSRRWFQSTLPARGSDIIRMDDQSGRLGVSIHAPREGERRLLAH